MSTNVGAVDFDVIFKNGQFNKQLANTQKQVAAAGKPIQATFNKIAKVAAAAFSIKKIVDFGASCINLGSDLAEVQNVVDVAFPKMNEQVNSFAKNAIEQFGLSQTVAKKYMGTFGAMSKAFGFAETEAEKMSEKLTGLAGDVASFYNISSDEAYTKLKSVFTGETETLKDLGVVMTQSALDSYAMANGYGKTTSAMTEQEKVALRYQFVLDQLQLASGDFLRTQDGWANQTRVLTLRWQEFKATIGQGLINIFTPVLKVINMLLAKLQVLADAFKSFTEMIFGDAGGSSQGSSAISDVANSAMDASSAVDSVGASAKKAKKQLLGLRGIDVLHNTTTSDSNSFGGASTGAKIDFGSNTLSDTIKKANDELNPFMQKMQQLGSVFKEGFKISFGDSNFGKIQEHIVSIKDNLIEIWTDKKVVQSSQKWAEKVSFSLGQIVGSTARIGTNIVEGLVGSVDKYIEKNKERLKERLSKMFEISGEDIELTGNFFQALGEISDVFKSDTAKQIGADLIAIFVNPLMSVQEVCAKFVRDVKAIFFQPIIDNVDKIKVAIENTLKPIQTITKTLAEAFTYVGDKWNEVYDGHIKPFLDAIKTGLSDTLGKFLDVYNTYVAPALQRMADKFSELWNTHLKPLVDNIGGLIGSIADLLTVFWNERLKPLIDWIVQNVLPILVPVLETLWNTVCNVFGLIGNAISHVIGVIKGIIDFIVGIFTGDWEKAWNAVKGIFDTIWDGIKNMFAGIGNTLKDIFKGIIDWIKAGLSSWGKTISGVWNNIWSGIKSVFSNIGNGIKNAVSSVFNGIKNTISSILNGIKTIWNNIWNGLKNTVSNIFNGIWNVIKKVINSILGGIEGMANGVVNGVNAVIRTLNRLKFDIPDWVPLFGGKTFGFNIPQLNKVSIPRLAEGGYFKANQPTLAMVGDNKTQSEIVSPVDKMQDALRAVLAEQKGQAGNTEIVRLLKELIQILKGLGGDTVLKIDNVELARAVLKGLKALQEKSDKPIFDFI